VTRKKRGNEGNFFLEETKIVKIRLRKRRKKNARGLRLCRRTDQSSGTRQKNKKEEEKQNEFTGMILQRG